MYTLNVLLSDGWTCCLNVKYQMYVYFALWLCHVLMLLPFQGVITFRHVNPGCRFACPGLCAPLGFYWHHRLRLSNSSKLDCIRLARWFSPPLLNPNPCQTTSRSSACPAARIVNDFSVASTKLSSLLGHLVKTCQLLQFISPKSVKQNQEKTVKEVTALEYSTHWHLSIVLNDTWV